MQSTPSTTLFYVVDVGAFGGPESLAFGINNDTLVVGSAKRLDGTSHAFRFDGSTIRDLGTVGGANSAAAAINKSGVVVGWSLSSAGNTKAFVYENGGMRNALPRRMR